VGPGLLFDYRTGNPGQSSFRAFDRGPEGQNGAGQGGVMWDFILWVIAVILVVWGIVSIFRSRLLMGVVLIIVGLLVGPGGVSLFT
jgi:hypothetical protein